MELDSSMKVASWKSCRVSEQSGPKRMQLEEESLRTGNPTSRMRSMRDTALEDASLDIFLECDNRSDRSDTTLLLFLYDT